MAGSFAVLPKPVQAAGQARPAPTSLSSHTVTLVTGDVVSVTTLANGRQIADVDRPDDAVGGVRLQEIDDDLYVVPDEAMLRALGIEAAEETVYRALLGQPSGTPVQQAARVQVRSFITTPFIAVPPGQNPAEPAAVDRRDLGRPGGQRLRTAPHWATGRAQKRPSRWTKPGSAG